MQVTEQVADQVDVGCGKHELAIVSCLTSFNRKAFIVHSGGQLWTWHCISLRWSFGESTGEIMTSEDLRGMVLPKPFSSRKTSSDPRIGMLSDHALEVHQLESLCAHGVDGIENGKKVGEIVFRPRVQ